MTLHHPSPVQLPPSAKCPLLRLIISTPAANYGPWQCPNPLLPPSQVASGAQQRQQFTMWLYQVQPWLPVGSRGRQQRTAPWTIRPCGPSWGRSRPSRRWITLPEPKGSWKCRRHRMPGWAELHTTINYLQIRDAYTYIGISELFQFCRTFLGVKWNINNSSVVWWNAIVLANHDICGWYS